MPEAFSDSDFTLIAAVNDDDILSQCLARSPDVVSGRLKLTAIRGARNMAEAYNAGLAQTGGRIALFAHQDVYLPKGWLDLAQAKLAELTAHAPGWMVAGPYGVRSDGQHAGLVWDAGLESELGEPGFGFAPVASLDELLLIARREDGFGFDPALPHFHLYGTDIVQTCLAAGRGAFAVELPVVHNSQRVATLSGGYTRAYRYTRDKWRARLPIRTTVCLLSANPWPLLKAKLRLLRAPRRTGELVHDAVELARTAGYETA